MAVRGRVVELLRSSGLPSGRTLGVDSTTLEANAAMRSIVRRDDGKGYEEWLEQVARASGIETPTREDLAKLDRTRPKKKTSNKDWVHPHDPEARIAKMKDGRTRMAHNRLGGDVNPGKESSKSNQDCTICRSCREIANIGYPKSRKFNGR